MKPKSKSLVPFHELRDIAVTRLFRMHEEADVGHLGGNLSTLDAMLVLFHQIIGPDDRFVLSKGHSAGALYVALWSKGLLSDADLTSFHQDGTRLPGHPPISGLPLDIFGTGSLGHGLSLAAGVALAMKFRGESHNVYCLTSDGEWQEGSTWEALNFIAQNRLSNLKILVDSNGLQGFDRVSSVVYQPDLSSKIASFGVEFVSIDGHDADEIFAALQEDGGPKCIELRTIKGFGWEGLEDTVDSHYLSPRRQGVAETRERQ